MHKPEFSWITPVLWVNDLVKSLAHYEEVLGFHVAWKWSETETFEDPDHPTFACVSRGECSLFLCEKGQGNPGSWICLNVNSREELNQLFKEYTKSGADIVEKPLDRSWGMCEMIVRDLDANVFRMGCQTGSDYSFSNNSSRARTRRAIGSSDSCS